MLLDGLYYCIEGFSPVKEEKKNIKIWLKIPKRLIASRKRQKSLLNKK
jgi:hypothetical protein